VEHLVANHPEQVNATGGYYLTPPVVALAAGHFQTAKFLYENGAHPNVRGYAGSSPLQSAVSCGGFEMIQVLLKYKADVHTRNSGGETSLRFASKAFSNKGLNEALLLDIVREKGPLHPVAFSCKRGVDYLHTHAARAWCRHKRADERQQYSVE
jgi:hypothetical protein